MDIISDEIRVKTKGRIYLVIRMRKIDLMEDDPVQDWYVYDGMEFKDLNTLKHYIETGEIMEDSGSNM